MSDPPLQLELPQSSSERQEKVAEVDLPPVTDRELPPYRSPGCIQQANKCRILPVQHNAALEKEQGWGAFSGTSAASPMVAGVCALLKEVDPELTPAQIKNLLKLTARDITKGVNYHGHAAKPGPDLATGFGLTDAERAVEAVL